MLDRLVREGVLGTSQGFDPNEAPTERDMHKGGAVVIDADDYRGACRNMQGWCTTCEEFTGDDCEPDAEQYECPGCGENTVYGAEQAMLLGFIEPKED